jgi:hypothetical protein
MSGSDDENLNDIDDSPRMTKVIARRIFSALYKRDREAREIGNSTWFDLYEIVDGCFKDDEKELARMFIPLFKKFYVANKMIVNDDSVRLTEEGKETIKLFFLNS